MQHCILQAFKQFGTLYMHNHDDKYPVRPGFDPGTSRLQALVDTNEPSRPAYTADSKYSRHHSSSSICYKRCDNCNERVEF